MGGSSHSDREATGEGSQELSRRRFLQSAALAAGALWIPTFRVGPASASRTCTPPPNFPRGIDVYQQGFENWAGSTRVDGLWTCAPRGPADVVTLANWGHANGWRIRARGAMHGWAPLAITNDTGCDDPVLLVDTTQHLKGMKLLSRSPAAVRVKAGTSLLALHGFLEERGLGFTTTPAVGNPTIAGILAISGHGAALPAAGEVPLEGHTYGSLSNLVVALTAVVWDESSQSYVLRTFERTDPECPALLTHLGRGFLTDVTLRVGRNQNLRCVSDTGVPASEMFAPPGGGAKRTFAGYVERAGRVEAIWFPFTEKPWLKVWSVRKRKPASSRAVSTPYNYPFSDSVPEPVAELANRIITGEPELAPLFAQLQYTVASNGLVVTRSGDLWGKSKNLLLYIKPSTLRVDACSHAIVTSRANIQRVVSEYAAFHRKRLDYHRSRGEFPINGPLEVRASGLDHPADVGIPGAVSPAISATTPREDRPDWDVAVWISVLTLPGTPGAHAYYRELEQFVLANYSGDYATFRPEWTKAWACTNRANWSDPQMLGETVPGLLTEGRPADGNFDWARSTLDTLDPHRVFSNTFLDGFLA